MKVLLFIYNTDCDILAEYKNIFYRFLSRNEVETVIYGSSEDFLSKTKELFPSVTKIECSKKFSSFHMAFISYLRENLFASYDYLYKIETKDTDFQSDACQVLLNWNLIESNMTTDLPLLCGPHKRKLENNKLFNREEVFQILERNDLDPSGKLYQYVDKYNVNMKTGRKKLLFQPSFYSFYENDLRRNQWTESASQSHWEEYGIKEDHRVFTPFVVDSYGATSFFIEGSTFCINKAYIKLLSLFNWNQELQDFQNGWETLFGLLPYLYNGRVISVENGNMFDDHYRNEVLDLSIYRGCNPDLAGCQTPEDLRNHFINNGWREDRVYSIRSLKKPQSLIKNPNFDADLAFFLKFPAQTSILNHVRFLLQKNYKIDLYFDVWDETVKCHGFVTSPISISQLDHFDDPHVNLFLGFHAAKVYKCAFVQDGIRGVNYVNKMLNLKVLKFLNEQTLIDFIQDQIK